MRDNETLPPKPLTTAPSAPSIFTLKSSKRQLTASTPSLYPNLRLTEQWLELKPPQPNPLGEQTTQSDE